jgi:hypothetical protein
MARTKENIITYGTTGRINNVVLKKRGKTQYISSLPDTSGVVATDQQTDHRDSFANAVSYALWAKNNPQAAFPFTPKEGQSVYNAAISYYRTTHKVVTEPADTRRKFNSKQLKELDLNSRQIKALLHLQNKGELTNGIYRRLTGVSKATATRDLRELVSRMFIISTGALGVGASYSLGH